MSCSPCIIVHGGVEEAGVYPMLVERIASCRKSACIGYEKLMNGATATEAVEAALRWLEDDELFNCGYGSVLNQVGEVQMDASIMNGSKLECGSVVAVSGVDHPISLAKHIMATTPNVILCERVAESLAKNFNGVTIVAKNNMISPAAHNTFSSSTSGGFGVSILPDDGIQVRSTECETVGCVAWDGRSLAAGSSTGGLTRKAPGRVGDSGIIGCGVHADDLFGCALTGHGESALTLGLARRMADGKRAGASAFEALRESLEFMKKETGRVAGAIGLGSDGSWAMYYTGSRMPFAYVKDKGVVCGAELSDCPEGC